MSATQPFPLAPRRSAEVEGALLVLFIGDDWAQAHHDIEIRDETGRRLARRRLSEGIAGVAALHELVGQFAGEDVAEDPSRVIVGIETDRGSWVQALLAAGYRVYAINPLSVARYRERHVTSGAKSGMSRRGWRAARGGARRRP
jgi:hypothetical protein